MSRLEVRKKSKAQLVVDNLYEDLERRIIASPPGLCPVDMTASFLKLFHAQTCGKCVPCRIGLGVLEDMLEDVLDGKATLETLSLIERTAKAIYDSADCAIGYEAGRMVLKGLEGFREDFIEHITNGHCSCHLEQPVPCVALCPAGVDVPGYISLIVDERYADAVKLIRKDNPFVTSCALVCEHPCETKCRRNFVDDAVNIRGLKRYAADHCGLVPPPECCESTGKTVAIIGGGPSGLSAAYYLQQMGHQCTIFEQRKELGGMLYYGIPNYRLPKDRLAEDIQNILATGVETKMNTCIGDGDGEISFKMLKENYDAPFFFHERGGGGDVLVAGHVAGEDKLTAELFGDGFHALVDGFTGIAERQPGALFLKAGSDSVRDASVVGYPEDEALFVFQQHGFLVVGTEWKRGLRRPGKSSPSDGQTGMIRESPFRRRRKGGFPGCEEAGNEWCGNSRERA